MSDHTPGPVLWAIAGAVIAWLLTLLKGAVSTVWTSEGKAQREFRERLEADITRLDGTLNAVRETVSDIDGRIKVLEERTKRMQETR